MQSPRYQGFQCDVSGFKLLEYLNSGVLEMVALHASPLSHSTETHRCSSRPGAVPSSGEPSGWASFRRRRFTPNRVVRLRRRAAPGVGAARAVVCGVVMLVLHVIVAARAATIQVRERDTNPPNFVAGTPAATHVTDTSLHIEFRMDKQGFFYFMILEDFHPDITVDQLIRGVAPVDPDDPPNRVKYLAKGSTQVTTTTRTFTTIVFEELQLDTKYKLWCAATDNAALPADRIRQPKPTLVEFRTLSGRTRIHWEHGDGFINGFNVLGVGTSATHTHWTPTLVPNVNNLTVSRHKSGHFWTLVADGHKINIGDIWTGRMSLSSGNDNPTDISPRISAGSSHWLGAMYDKRVLSMGHNENGRLGLGDDVVHLTATTVPGLNEVTEASAGMDFSVVLNGGSVYTFGANSHGQLGLNDTVERWTPTLVPGFGPAGGENSTNNTAVVAVSAGRDHMLFATEDGKVYAMGSNQFGQLGLGDLVDRWTPTLIESVENVSFIMAGQYHSVISTHYPIPPEPLPYDRNDPNDTALAALNNFTFPDGPLNGTVGGRLLSFGYNFRSGGEFYGYSRTTAKCYQLWAGGCLPEY